MKLGVSNGCAHPPATPIRWLVWDRLGRLVSVRCRLAYEAKSVASKRLHESVQDLYCAAIPRPGEGSVLRD